MLRLQRRRRRTLRTTNNAVCASSANRLWRSEEVRLGLEDGEIEDGIHAGEDFPEAAFGGPAEWDRFRGVGDGVDAEVAAEDDGAGRVEIVADDGDAGEAEDVVGARHGIEGAKAGIIQREDGLWDAFGHEGVFHVGGFVVAGFAVVSAEEEMMHFAGVVELGSSSDATGEEGIGVASAE